MIPPDNQQGQMPPQPPDEDTSEAELPAKRKTRRVFISERIARALVAIGIPDDNTSITKEVNRLLDGVIKSHAARVVTLADVVAVEQSLADRLEELTATNIALAQVLYDLGAVIDTEQFFSNLRHVVKFRVPAEDQSAPPAKEPSQTNDTPPSQ